MKIQFTAILGVLVVMSFTVPILYGDGTAAQTDQSTAAQSSETCTVEDEFLCASLIEATRDNRVDDVRALLADGADPEVLDANGLSAWAYALGCGTPDTINAFIDGGMPAGGIQRLPHHMVRGHGVPPLVFAISQRNTNAIGVLISNGADPAELGPYGYPAANFAPFYGNVEAMKALRAAGVDLNAAIPAGLPHDGETFLIHAAQGGSAEAVEFLISIGSDGAWRDPRGKNASDHAKAYGQHALAAHLADTAK